MSKLLVCTRADDNIAEMCSLTHPILKRYAEKCNADFLVIEDSTPYPHFHYRILKLYELFNTYSRIFMIDSDILIRKDCPNLFTVVPEDKIGSILEDKGSRKEHRQGLIKEIQEQRGSVNWTEGYINSGVIVFSKIHQPLFEWHGEDLWMGFGRDDIELGYRLHKLGFEVYELPFQYNHMTMYTEPWNNNADRFDSYVWHFAGNGFYLNVPKIEQIKQDLLIANRYGLLL